MLPRSRIGVTFGQIVGVLAIIAFVAAVLFPVFQHPISNSPRASCASNMEQLGLAMWQYEQDADGEFPPGTTPAGNGWAGQLYPFVKSTGVYHCPDDAAEGKFISYAENQNLVRENSGNLTNPLATVELYEFTTLGCEPAIAETVSATGLRAPQDSKRHDSPHFPFGLNFAFADGHVKYLMPGQVSGGPGAVRPKALPQGAYVGTFALK